jgi:hypothetical protein
MTPRGLGFSAGMVSHMTSGAPYTRWKTGKMSKPPGKNFGPSSITREMWEKLRTRPVPQLVRIHLARGVADWNSYALVATIEEARRNDRNPSLPASLQPAYEAAWHELIELALRDLRVADEPLLVSSILAVLAIGKRQFSLGRMALLFDEDERRNILAKAGWP